MQLPYQRKTVTISAGSVAAPIAHAVMGKVRFLMLVGASDASKVGVRFGSGSAGMPTDSPFLLQYGKIGPLPDGVDRFEILNASGAPNTIDIIWGVSDFNYAPPTTTAVSSTADGADVTQGAKANAVATTDTGTFSVVSLVKRLLLRLTALFDHNGVRLAGATASMTGTASTAVLAAPGAGFHLVVDAITAHNTHATQDTEIAILDGAAELFRVYVKAGTATGGNGPVVIPMPRGLQLTTNTALNAQNITTGAATRVAAFGVKEAD